MESKEKIQREAGVCIFCDEPVYIGDKERQRFMLAIERPLYLNLWVHRDCYKKYRDDGTLRAFITENLYSYLDKYNEEKDGKKKKVSKPRPEEILTN
jgi:hypothetical protein